MFLFKHSCRHEKISAGIKKGYCPDCGKLVENRWFVTRCPICGKRHKTVLKNGKPFPAEKLCSNCGTSEFQVEEIDFPDIVTINYATYISEIVSEEKNSVQAWIENAGKISFLPMIPA